VRELKSTVTGKSLYKRYKLS